MESNNNQCLDCELIVDGKFCPNCGQKQTSIHKSLGTFFGDFFGDVFSFDSRLF